MYKEHLGLKGTKEKVLTVQFSDWLIKHFSLKQMQGEFNIIKVNIEGAEKLFFDDMIAHNLLKTFNIICGDDFKDLYKINEFKDKAKEYIDNLMLLFKQNNIKFYKVVGRNINGIVKINNDIRNYKIEGLQK